MEPIGKPDSSNKTIFKIGSLNINGMNRKLKAIEDFIKRHQIDVLCVQQTYQIDQKLVETWTKANHFTVFPNSERPCEMSSWQFKAGTAFIINNRINHDFEISHKINQKNQLHTIKLARNDIKCNITNCYYPQKIKDKYALTRKLAQTCDEQDKTYDQIIVGDFNFVTDEIDTLRQKAFKSNKNVEAFKEFTDKNKMLDAFRYFSDTDKVFTFRTKNSGTRIDRIYIHENIVPIIRNVTHYQTTQTDHELAPILELNLPSKLRWGKGSYCLNNEILDYHHVKIQIENLWGNWQKTKSNFETLSEWWETGKSLVKWECIKLSTEIKASQKDELKLLEQKLMAINSKQNLMESDLKEKLETRQKLEALYAKKYEGSRIRAKIEKIENEIPNKSFYAAENNRAVQKGITQLKNEKGETIEGKDAVLKETHNFYNQLWGKNETLTRDREQNEYAQIMANAEISETESKELETLITENEIMRAIAQLNTGSSPGSDGLTSEFYKKFAYLLKTDLTEVYNNCYFAKNMTSSMKKAIVKLIYKKMINRISKIGDQSHY